MAARISRRALVSLVAAALLVAPSVRAQTPVEITFWSWVPGIEAQVDAFNESQSDIHVTYINKGNGNTEYAAFRTALEANSDVPDTVQIEFQHLPSFIARNELANLADHGAAEIADQFVPWTWAQVSTPDGGVYAYPQDAGPMIMMCNTDLLESTNTAVPTTWEEFEAAAASLHAANPNAYLANFTSDQGHWFGLLWQSGAHTFAVDGTNMTIDLTSPEATRVAELWDRLRASGNLAPVDTYTPDWSTAIGNGTIACWTSGAWGPQVIEPAAADLAGKWEAYQMPAWTAGEAVNGNYGGSTIAVTAASQHPAEAETFNRWLNSDPAPTLALANPPAGLFPVTNVTLENPEWTGFTSDFWSGQKLHEITAEAASTVDTSFQWPPITDFVYTTLTSEFVNVQSGAITLAQAMQNLQTQVTQYATDQGYTVVTP